MGNSPTDIKLEKRTEIQLFASTVIGDKILTINAPVMNGGSFEEACLIVNELMESLKITRH